MGDEQEAEGRWVDTQAEVVAATVVAMGAEEMEEEVMEAAQAGLEAGCLVGCLVEETGKAATPRLSTPQTESSDPSQCLPQERSARQS